jgi:galactokinase
VPIPKGVTLMALDTGKRRQLVESEYGTRRAQCEEASRLLNIKALRDITPEQLAANADKLPEVISRRASHVVNENARTLAAVDALRTGDLQTVGRLINESHASLRDLYEVSIHELDVMAELAQKTKGCYGARMMGGGFGGAVIALVDDAANDQLAQEVAEAYNAATHLKAYVYKAKPGPGSSVEQLS